MTRVDPFADHVLHFRDLTQLALEDMFACGAKVVEEEVPSTDRSFLTEMPFNRILSSSGFGAAAYAVLTEINSWSTSSLSDSVKSIIPSW